MGTFMSGADTVDAQERLHTSHPEVQNRQLTYTHTPSAYFPYSPYALACGCLVPEFPSPLRLLLRLYMAQKAFRKSSAC